MFSHSTGIRRHTQTRWYDLLYFTGLALALVAAFALFLQLRREFNLGADITIYHVLLAALPATGWFLLAHHKRLVLLQSDPWSYGLYHLVLGAAIVCLVTGILLDPLSISGLVSGWQEVLLRMEASEAANPLRDKTVLDILRSGADLIWEVVKTVFFSMFWVLLRAALTILCIAALISGLLALVVMYFTDIKSGVLVVLLALMGGACGWYLQVTDQSVNYGLMGVLALMLSVLLSVNWRSLYINVDIEEYHPQYYQLITRLNRVRRTTLPRAAVREEISHAVSAQAGEFAPQVIDAIERRLVEERLLVPRADQTYAPGFQKRLRAYHVMVGGLALLYVFNPGFGVLELIPDNLPLVGNLDEVLIGLGAFSWIYSLYRKDRLEARGEYATPPDFGAFVPAPASSPAGPALPQPKTPLLPREED